VVIQNYSQFHIDAHINTVTTTAWRFTGFYGDLEHGHQRESWAPLKHLGRLDNKPWLCMWDFNEILALHEKAGGKARPMKIFMWS
jgi:hypothetical protein